MRLSIKQTTTAALATGLAAVLLAACGGGDDSGSATAADKSAGVVSVRSVDGSDVLADSAGKTLYSAKVERGHIRCTGACTSFWEPVTASAKQADSAASRLDLDFGVVRRPDGDEQLTFKGLPLYSFTEEGAGKLDGDGFTDDFQGTHFEWAAASVKGGSGSSSTGTPMNSSPY
jgi:predicted lipoprotein with Yx(FWY)xxD motif